MAGLLSNQYDPSVNSSPDSFDPSSIDSDLTAPRSFDDVQQILNKQAADAVNKGASEADVLAQLKQRTDQLAAAWSQYGPSAFTPKTSTPQFDPMKDDVADAESVKGKAASNISGLLKPIQNEDPSSIGNILAQADQANLNADRTTGDIVASAVTGYTPAGMTGLLAGGVSGASKDAWDIANFALRKGLGYDDKSPDLMEGFSDTARKVAENMSFQPKSDIGKAIQAPLQAIQEGSEWLGGKTLQYTGSPEAAAAVDVAAQFAPWVVAGKLGHMGYEALAKEKAPIPLPPMDKSSFEDVPEDKTAINVPPGGFKDTPKTGDPAIDAGIDAGNEFKRSAEQGDLFSKTHELGQDLFSNGPEGSVPADTIEARRQQAEMATRGELPQRSDQEQAKLEQDYLLDQQDRLNRGSQQEDLVSRRGDIPEPYLGIPHADMPQGDVNTQMHREMLQALADRGQLRNKATLVPPTESTTGQLFEPSSNERVEQNQVQGRLDLPTQQDLFGNSLPEGTPKEEPAAPTTQAPAKSKAPKDTAETVRARLAEKLKSVPAPETVTPTHGEILDLADKGELKASHVLDAVIDNVGPNSPPIHKEAGAFAQVLKSLMDKFGGADTPIHVVDMNNPEHAARVNSFLADHPKYADGASHEGRWGGFYDPETKQIFINGERNLKPVTLIHEAAHAVTHAALDLGDRQALPEKQQMAYNALRNVFEELKPHLDQASASKDLNDFNEKSRSDRAISTSNRTYGLTNLHEMISELYSNPEFRQHLKDLKLDPTEAAKLGLSRTTMGKIGSMFDAVVKPIKKMLGLSEKASNGLDALFAAHDHFFNSFSDERAKVLKEHNDATSKPGEVDNTFNARRNFELAQEAKARLDEAVKARQDSEAKNNTKTSGSVPSEAHDDDPLGHTPLKATITDPLSNWQKLQNTAKTVLGTLRTATGPRREFQVAKEEARGSENEALMNTMRGAKGLEATMKAEGAPAKAVTSYMQPHVDDEAARARDNAALDKYPNTKQYVDDFMKKPTVENAKVLAKLIADNPNATLKNLLMAEKIHDNPAYTMIGYQPQAYTDGLFRNAQSANAKEARGIPLTPEEGIAKKAVDNLTDWVKQNLIPSPEMRTGVAGDKTIGQLRNMAKSLGLRPAQILKGLGKDEKSSALVKAINEAVPEKDVDIAVQRLARDIAGITNSGTSIVSKYYRGARFGDILMARESVPPEIQAVWGKVQDPVSIMIQTLMKQARGIAQLKQQYDIKDKGQGRHLFDTKVGAPDGYTAQLKGPKFGPLQGMWTTPDLKTMLSGNLELSTAGERLTQALNTGNVDDAFRSLLAKSSAQLWGKGVSLYKAKRLITDPGYYIMYAAGGPSIMAIHGIVDPRYAVRGLAAHIAELSPNFLKALPDGLREGVQKDLSNVVKSGMNEFQMQGEIMDDVAARKYAEAMATGMQQDPLSVMKVLGSVLMKARDMGMTGLSLTDGYAKRAALFHRQDVLRDFYQRNPDQGNAADAEAIRKEAADWVKDTTITSSRTPVAVRLAEKMGLSQGLIYAVETVRNGYNAIAHGMSDFSRGYQANDPIMMTHGLKQIAGTGLAVNYMGGLITASMSALLATAGITSQVLSPTDPQQPYLQQKGSRFEGQRPVKLGNTGDRDNTWWWAPGDRNDFYYQLSQPVHVLADAWARKQAGQDVDVAKETKSAMGAFLGTFFNNSFPKKILDMVGNKAPSWTKNAPDAYEKLNTFYRENLGVDSKTANSIISFEDIFHPGVLNGALAANESQASTPIKVMQTLGMGATKIGNDADLSTRTGAAVKNEFADVKRELDTTTRSEMNYSDDIVKKDYARAMQDGEKVMTKLKDAFDFAKANGKDVGEVFEAAKAGGVPEKAILQAISGNYNPATMLQSDLATELKDKMVLYKDDPVKQQKMTDIFIHRMLLVNDLSTKYQTMTPQQLKEIQ